MKFASSAGVSQGGLEPSTISCVKCTDESMSNEFVFEWWVHRVGWGCGRIVGDTKTIAEYNMKQALWEFKVAETAETDENARLPSCARIGRRVDAKHNVCASRSSK